MNACDVVFLHGIGGAARAWGPQQASFAQAGLRPLALDLPGYGERPAVERLSFDLLAADVESTIDRLRLDRPVLVGHSMGGMIAQTMLRRRPRGYRAAVLSGTSPAFGNPSGDFQKQFLADRLGPLERGQTMPELATAIIDQMMGPAPEPAGRALAIACMGAVPAATYRASVLCLITFDERANLGQISIPVLVLAGEHDRNAPPTMMERMAAKIPGARYVCLLDVGHLPSLESPTRFDHAILSFLRDLPEASG
ncbi:MAG: alpha/beta fold hydrolase [Hyphomicrobiales bacterium]|nr:alpha/beta fold hydrolase [Hyphomicrobiales bacterium]